MLRAPAGIRTLPDEAATARFGAELAGYLRPGDVVALAGELGAGKTALARAIIRTLMGEPNLDVPSPSYALVQPYSNGEIAILHADLYRLRDPGDVLELGLLDDAGAIVLIEWIENGGGLLDLAQLVVSLSIPPGGVGRQAIVEAEAGRNLSLA